MIYGIILNKKRGCMDILQVHSASSYCKINRLYKSENERKNPDKYDVLKITGTLLMFWFYFKSYIISM